MKLHDPSLQIGFLFTSTLALALAACSSDPPAGTGGGATTGNATTGSATTGTGGATTGTGGATTSSSTTGTGTGTGGSGGQGGGTTTSTGSEGVGGGTTTGGTGGGTTTSGNGGAGGGTSSSTGNGGAGGGATSSSSSTGGGIGCSDPNAGLPINAACTPKDPSCSTQTSECLALQDYAGAPSFGLRIADFSFSAPAAFTKGIIKNVVENGVMLNHPACNQGGGGTFSWLLAFDTATGKLTTGVSKPAASPAQGFSFVDQDYPTVTGGVMHVGPVTTDAPVNAACGFSSTKVDVVLALYLDMQASSAILLPLRQLQFLNAMVSGDHNCIGTYNATTLQAANNCLPDAQNRAFTAGAQASAFISLEDADLVPITALGQSLCVLLSGDAGTYGNGAKPINRCKRVNNQIVFKGDWCFATDGPASANCADAVKFGGVFAASGVKIN